MKIIGRILSILIILSSVFISEGCSQSNIAAVTNTIEQNMSTPDNSTKNEFILYNSSVMDKLRDGTTSPDLIKSSIDKVAKSANSALKTSPLSVTQKKIVAEGHDPHDYISMAIYYWPDPSKEDSKPYINKDGQVNPEKNDSDKYDASRFSKMISTVNTLSLGYYLTGKEDYSKHAAELLRTWFINSDTKMNPNLKYGQEVPGKNTGSSTGIIDTASLITITDSIRMLEKSENWTDEESTQLKKWFSDYVDWLLQSTFGKKEAQATNNHSVWYDAQVAAFSYYAGREDIARTIVEQSKSKRISGQIEKDGSMPRELTRTRSMDYTMYNLEAFVTLAQLGDKLGIDLWNYTSEDGKSIQLAFDYLYPYFNDKSSWKYQNIVQENTKGFAPYLAIAAQKLKRPEYGAAAVQILENNTGRENIMAYTFLQ